ncbi:MAG: type 1 glutamine amidotransferase domain-containing protein [Elusimicrobiota bacterium]
MKVAILVERHYQDLEVWYPYLRLKEAGVKVFFVGSGTAKKYLGKYGYPADVDYDITEINPKDFDGVVIPGGWAPDFLRRHQPILDFIRELFKAGKVVACICHGGWVLVSADIIRDRTMTGFSAIKDDLKNAGANFIDQEVVIDGNLITSRNPSDLPAFCREILKALKI